MRIYGVIAVIITALAFSYVKVSFADAASDVPEVDLNARNEKGEGTFKLVICDGPDYSSLKKSISISWNGQNVTVPPNPQGYVPCDFKGLILQAQYLINVMLVVGVVAALAGFSYAGFLYMKGDQGSLSMAHKIFPKIVWGFILMLTAWFIVYQILAWLTPDPNVYLNAVK